MQANAVASLNNQNVYNQIQNWLNNKGKKSAQTKRNYEGHVRQFFGYTRNLDKGSEIESLSPSMLEYTHHDIVAYQNYLADLYKRNGEIVGGTVNVKMSAVKALFKYLSIDNKNIDMNIFNAIERMTDNPDSYGWLTPDEVFKMCELALELDNGYEKSILIELAARTGIRVQALLNVTTEDVQLRDNGYWYVYALEKGQKKSRKPLPKEIMGKIDELRSRSQDGKLFHMSPKTADRTVKDLAKEMGLDEKRNITFHSLKKTGIMYELLTTGNIHMATLHGNHSDPRTTMKFYASEFDEPAKMPGVRMGLEGNEDDLEKLSREELLQVIRSCSPSTRIEIVNKANQLHADSV